MSNSYIFYKIFVLLFFSFFIFACGNNKSASTTNTTDIVLRSLKQSTSIKEGATSKFVFELNKASINDITFDWSVQHHSTSTSDFTGVTSGLKIISAGDTSITISIETSDDSVYEGNESFALSITNVIGAIPKSLLAGGSIIDDQDQPIIAFEVVSNAVEGASFTYRLQLNKASFADVSFDWYVEHLLTSTSDFASALAGRQSITAGDTTATISIDTSDDSIYEGNESFVLHLTNVAGATPDRLEASGSIIDDQDQPIIAFEVVSNAVEGASFTYRLQLNKASLADISFDWYVEHLSTSTSDFASALAGRQSITAGDTVATISINTSTDNIYEGDESFVLHLTNVAGATPDRLEASGSIIDNNTQPIISFKQADSTTALEGASFTYRLQLNKASFADISFDWYVEHLSTSTSDFASALAGRQSITAGDTVATISIDTSTDNIYEVDESFVLHLTNVAGATPDRLEASGSIIDNNTQPIISFKQVVSNAVEGASFTYRLQLNKASFADISFDWYVEHLSTSTSDFASALAGRQSITAGDTVATISINTSIDNIYEVDESFVLHLTNVAGATPDRLEASGSIIDNNTQPIISFKQADSTTALEGASFTYRLQLNKASFADISFDWYVEHLSTSTSDFASALAGRQSITAGDTVATISIDTSDDSIYEGNESFVLHLTNVAGATPDRLEASGSIIDNNTQPIISFKQADSTTALEGASLSYSLQLNKVIAVDISFDWYVQHLSTSTSDFTSALAGRQSITAGDTTATIELQINNDNLPEQAETFTLNVINITGATPDSLSASITILENDIDITVDYNGNGLIDIVTEEQLDNIRYNLAGTSYKTSNSDASMNCNGNLCRGYELFANLDLSAFANWQPIGSQHNPFTSILQGNGYSITNLVIDGGNNIGLFSALSGATIDNLVVEVASITGDSYVGALAGRAITSTITRVQIRAANANSKLQATGEKVGGMLGEMTSTTITNVTSDLSIVGGNNDNANNAYYVGGIVGYVSSSNISYATSSSGVFVRGAAGYVGGLVGELTNSTISYTSVSGNVSISFFTSGSTNYVGGLVGEVVNSTISYTSASGNVRSSGAFNDRYGGLAGSVNNRSTISYTSASGNVISDRDFSDRYGGLVGEVVDSVVSYTSASGRVANNGGDSEYYGGLVGVSTRSTISDSSASGSVTSNGEDNNNYGGLVGELTTNSTISYSSASGSVTSNGENNNNYGGLVGELTINSTISYSSASGNVISSIVGSDYYGGLVGVSDGEVQHSWSSSSVFASNPAGLVGNNEGNLKFSYAIGVASYGLVATNTGTIIDSYWNSETSGALKAVGTGATTNILPSNTAGMLASTGSAGASVFADFADATDKLDRNIWTFVNGHYPVIEEIGADSQAVALAYGLLRLANPYVSDNTLDSFLGATINNEDIELIANSYNANDTLAILDVNLLVSNSAICAAGSTDIIMTTTGANGTTISLQKIAGSIEITKKAGNSCDIIFSNQKTDGTLQLAAIISKGAASLTKKFEITLNTIQSIISLQPTTLNTREGDNLIFTLELNHKARRDIAFDWSVQHSSTSTSDFAGAIFGSKTILAEATDATIELQINDDDRPENAEDFTLNITNIRGVTHNNLSVSITIVANDLNLTVDYNGNGLIDIVTEEQLGNIRYNLAGTSYKASNSDASMNCNGNICRGYELFANLDLSAFANWQPIGSTRDSFRSRLQGNGYSITNLAIDGGNNIGLFSALSGATIDNLVVEVASISGDSYVGALAGRAITSTISRVQIRAANTNSKLSATGEKVGGMLGEIIGTTITNVTSDLSIVGNNDNANYVGGIVGYVSSSDISYAYSSGSVTSNENHSDNYGGLVGFLRESTIDYSSASGEVTSNGGNSDRYGGLVGVLRESTIRYSSASGEVTSNGGNSDRYGGLVGFLRESIISDSSASGSVTSNGDNSNRYGGLVGFLNRQSIIHYSSASGSVTSNGDNSDYYGGLVGFLQTSIIRYSSASSSVTSTGTNSNDYGGLVGHAFSGSKIRYSSASGNVGSGVESLNYGGLVGIFANSGNIIHSWSSSSVRASGLAASLIGYNEIDVKFNYALGAILPSGFGLAATSTGTITNSYWNSETSGALAAGPGSTTNIASSDTAGMLDSTGSANARIFKGFFDATDELNRKIWTFTSDSYPVIAALGIDEQAVALAYGLLRLAHPTTTGGVSSFLGGTLHNENIVLDVVDYSAGSTLAIVDVNLLQSSSADCTPGSTDSTLTTTGANQAVVILSITAATNNLHENIVYTDCSIAFDDKAVIQAGAQLQLVATITKGLASLTKKFVINFQ